MSNRTLQQVEPACRHDSATLPYGVDAWLRHALTVEFGGVAQEPLPDALRTLLPAE